MMQEHIELQDVDLATIIYHAPLPISQTHQFLKKGRKNRVSRSEKANQCVMYDQMCLERFTYNDGSCFYETIASENAEKWDSGDITGHFSTTDLAINHAMSLGLALSSTAAINSFFSCG